MIGFIAIILAVAVLSFMAAIALFPAPNDEMKSDEYDIHALNTEEEYLEAVSGPRL